MRITKAGFRRRTRGLDYRAAGRRYRGRRCAGGGDQAAGQGDRRAGVMGGLGGFGALFDLKAAGFTDPVLVSTTDGVGTKLKIAIETGLHDTVGIDLVAMCVNDLVVQGAEPLFFLDYFATGKLSVAAGPIGHRRHRQRLSRGRLRPGWRRDRGNAGDVCGGRLRLGWVRGRRGGARQSAAPAGRAGDAILGLASSGVHSNGFPLVRRVVEASGLPWTDPAPFAPDQALGQALMTPTRIYVRAMLALHRAGLLKAAAHITGGGLPGNLPRVLPDGTVAALTATWPVPPVFGWLARTGGVEAGEMLRVFNCGVGMAVVVSDADAAIAMLEAEGETVSRIGRSSGRPLCPDRHTGRALPGAVDPPPGWPA